MQLSCTAQLCQLATARPLQLQSQKGQPAPALTVRPNLAVKAHRLPLQVHGTCLGFEAMVCDVAGTDKILTR